MLLDFVDFSMVFCFSFGTASREQQAGFFVLQTLGSFFFHK